MVVKYWWVNLGERCLTLGREHGTEVGGIADVGCRACARLHAFVFGTSRKGAEPGSVVAAPAAASADDSDGFWCLAAALLVVSSVEKLLTRAGSSRGTRMENANRSNIHEAGGEIATPGFA
jgi:hypothetical protein